MNTKKTDGEAVISASPYNPSARPEQYSLFEQEAERDQLCFDIFFKEGPFGLILLDRYFQLFKVNSRLEHMLGRDASEMMGRLIFEYLTEEDALSFKSILQNSKTLVTPLLVSLGLIRKGNNIVMTDAYVRKYKTKLGEDQYCILLFEKEFCPNRQLLELKQEVYDAIIITQEQERQDIGNFLHDSVAQLLYAARLNLQHFVLEYDYRERIVPVKKMLNEAIHQIRNLSMDLVPSVLNDFGLKAALKTMAERIAIPGFEVTALVQEKCETLPDGLKLAIYRIVQELLNNCMKHAMATKVRVKISSAQDTIVVEVTDNGKGFAKELEECVQEGSGLRNIKSRIHLYNGDIKIKANKIGSTVLVNLQVT